MFEENIDGHLNEINGFGVKLNAIKSHILCK